MSAPVKIFGKELAHPVINGSGTFDLIAAHQVFGPAILQNFPFAAYVTKTITKEPRQGNPPARIWELGNGMINSIGLPNKGLVRFAAEDLEFYKQLQAPLIVSVMGNSYEELAELVEGVSIASNLLAIELNFSCPNVKTGTVFGADPEALGDVCRRLSQLGDVPLIAKLTPSASNVPEVALAAEAGGAAAVSLINTIPGLALTPGSDTETWLGAGSGGVSGAAVKPVALTQLRSVAAVVKIPIIGMGGISNVIDAKQFLGLGATLVAVGTENFRDPMIGKKISQAL